MTAEMAGSIMLPNIIAPAVTVGEAGSNFEDLKARGMTDTEAGLGMVVGMIASKVGAKGAMKVTESTVRAASKKMFGKEIGQLDKAEIYRLGEALMEEGIGKTVNGLYGNIHSIKKPPNSKD